MIIIILTNRLSNSQFLHKIKRSKLIFNFKLIDLELNLFSYKNREKTNDYLESFLFKNILKKFSEKVKVIEFIDKERGLRLKINDFNFNHINKNSV